MIVGQGNVSSRHEFLTSSPDSLRDHFPCLGAHVRENEDLTEEEAACNRPSFLQRLLGALLRFLDILDAYTGAIVIMVELVERTEVATKRQRPCNSISSQAVQH